MNDIGRPLHLSPDRAGFNNLGGGALAIRRPIAGASGWNWTLSYRGGWWSGGSGWNWLAAFVGRPVFAEGQQSGESRNEIRPDPAGINDLREEGAIETV